MTRRYWDDLADTYDEQIFSVLRNDRAGTIAAWIARYAGATRTAADLGCGPGQLTGLLAAQFGHVQACDVSGRLLDQARAACARFRNVSFHQRDLAAEEPPPFAPVDFAICINVLLTADLETRERLWDRIAGSVAANGVLLLVLPSHESALYTNFRRLDWHVRAGLDGDEAIRHSLARAGDVPQLEHGVRPIEGVPTKHYLREEILVQLADRSLCVEEVVKLTYDWSTEFADPPDWMGAPYPWNWLVRAKRQDAA